MGDRDRPDGRPGVGLGGDGVDGVAAYGADTLALRIEQVPTPPRTVPRMTRLRPRRDPR